MTALSDQRFRQISGTIAAAARGEPWAEEALGRLDDGEFDQFLRERRQRRLTDPAQATADYGATEAKLPTFPNGTGAGRPSVYNADAGTDDRQLRGITRIVAALQVG